jgi:hypothetical protein
MLRPQTYEKSLQHSSQSNYCESQRQRSKNLQYHEQPSAFLRQKYFILQIVFEKTL